MCQHHSQLSLPTSLLHSLLQHPLQPQHRHLLLPQLSLLPSLLKDSLFRPLNLRQANRLLQPNLLLPNFLLAKP